MRFVCYITLFVFSSAAFSSSDYIIDCQISSPKSKGAVTYILNTKKGIAEILRSENTIKGVLGTDEHFYTLYFTYNKKTENEVVTTTIINRITGELTETATSASSYPNKVGEKITGKCKAKEYAREL